MDEAIQNVTANVPAIVEQAKATEQGFVDTMSETPKLDADSLKKQEGAVQPETRQLHNHETQDSLDWMAGLTSPDSTYNQQQASTEPVQEYKTAPIGGEPLSGTPNDTNSSKTKDGVGMDTFLKVRNVLQSRICATLAKTGNTERYSMTDDDLNLLTEIYAPYADAVTGMLPPWVMILAVELTVTGGILARAMNDRKQVIRYETAPNSNDKSPAPENRSMGVPEGVGERTNFKLHGTTGCYSYSKKYGEKAPNFISVAQAKEKPNVNDLEEMKHVILKNGGWKRVSKILELSPAWFEQNGLNTDNPTLADEG